MTDLQITEKINQLEKENAELKALKIQYNIESKYEVKLNPRKVGFHRSVITQFAVSGRLSTKQIERLKNPLYPIK